MNLPTLIDVALGLSLVFFILASLGSLLAELWAAHQKLRHRLLRQTVTRLLEPGVARKFWQHSLIQPLYGSSSTKTKPDAAVSPVPVATPRARPAAVLASPSLMERTKNAARALVRRLKRLISKLSPREAEAPAYLDAKLFVATVLDLASGQGAAGRVPNTVGAWEHVIRTCVPAIPGANNDLQDRLLAILRQIPAETADVVAALKTAVAHWYEENMQRASGAYRRATQRSLLVIGCILALAVNVDTLRITQILYQSPELSKFVAQQAEQTHTQLADANGNLKPPAPGQSTQQQLQADTGKLRDLVKVGFPLGWMPVWRENFIRLPEATKTEESPTPAVPVPAETPTGPSATGWFDRLIASLTSIGHACAQFWHKFTEPGWVALFAKVFGLAASAFAVCLGAPFWFDILGRLVKLRSSAGSDAEKKKTEDGSVPAAGPETKIPAPNLASPLPPLAPSPASLVDTLGAAGTAFDIARTYWLAEFADHAYDIDAANLTRWLSENDFALVKSFDANGTQGFLATSRGGVAVLVFRGTGKKLEDWVSDAKFDLVPGAAVGVPGQIHDGFAEALALVGVELDASLDELANKRVLLHVTGHSLGAALATLAAMRCAGRETTKELVHTVHTYGSPRVGDPEFVSAFEKKFHARTYRVVNNEDLVTRVPPRIFPSPAKVMHYDHVGEMIYIDEAGRIQRDIGYWYRFLNFVTNALGDLKVAVKTTVKDHSMQFYCGFLKKAAQAPRAKP